MLSDSLQPIREALKAGDKQTAQKLLRPLLKDQPSAEVWYLAAQACKTDDKAIECLRYALELEPQHSGANRMLFKLEGAKPKSAVEEVIEPPSIEALAELPPLKKVRNRRKRSASRTLVLISLLALGMCCSLVTMNLVGIITGPITTLTEITGGPTPVGAIDGTPIADVNNAPLLLTPSQSKPIQDKDADVLEAGYEHEYTFAAQKGTAMAIYVQFLSLAANQVSRNVVVVRPDGSDATPKCEHDTIIQGDNNVTLTCEIDITGTWKVRILGRQGESVGAYFVGVEPIQA